MRDIILMDSQRPDDTQPLERERIHLLLLEDTRRGMEDIAAGCTKDADAALARLQKSRAGKIPRKRGCVFPTRPNSPQPSSIGTAPAKYLDSV
ncbi:MAG: hypothetical protein LT080_13530 [Thiobacillus sp.]|nr:hypothetical protein [Thiobacillus sp.]